jgi:hypothetical protein
VSYVFAKGNLAGDAKASDAAKKLGWRVTRHEIAATELGRALEDLDAVLGDHELWKKLAKNFDLDAKARPKSKVVPLKGQGVPAGARALVVVLPPDLTESLQKRAASGLKVETKEPVRIVVAVCPDGQNATVGVVTSDEKDAAQRLKAYFASGGRRIGERADLTPLTSSRALFAEVFTWLGLLDSLPSSGVPTLPNRGETPMFSNLTAELGPPLVLAGSVTIPATAFADLPGIAMSVGAALDR